MVTKTNNKTTNTTSMKKALFFFACILLFSGAQTQAQVTWHTPEEASQATIGNRLFFFDFYTNWCGYCKKMDRETFKDPTVAAILNKYYYPVKFNAEGNFTHEWKGRPYNLTQSGRSKIHEFALATLGKQIGFPTFVLFKADRTPIQAIPGYHAAKEFTTILWYFASGDCDKYPYERYSQIFDKEIRPQMNKQLGLADSK